jgi:hypothetical protein
MTRVTRDQQKSQGQKATWMSAQKEAHLRASPAQGSDLARIARRPERSALCICSTSCCTPCAKNACTHCLQHVQMSLRSVRTRKVCMRSDARRCTHMCMNGAVANDPFIGCVSSSAGSTDAQRHMRWQSRTSACVRSSCSACCSIAVPSSDCTWLRKSTRSPSACTTARA